MEISEAYWLVERPSVAYERYITANQTRQRWVDNYPRFRDGLNFLKPEFYRGFSRYPLTGFPITDVDQLRSDHWYEGDINTAAKLKMFEFINQSTENIKGDNSTLRSLEQAVEIYDLLDTDQKDKYEIIRISRNVASTLPNTLGFDIGYWGGHFSIISDCVIMPEWHGPSWEDLPAVAEQARKLNSNLLFENFAEAESYKKFYKSYSWAETEWGNEFVIIRIDACALPAL